MPDSSNLVTINHSTALLKTKNIYDDGNITNVTSITSTTFIGNLTGNSSTVTNGVYLNNTGTQTINGNISVKQLNIDGTRTIYQTGTGGTDTRANLRVLANLSTDTNNQDGMLINYDSTGGSNADIKFYANGVQERMRILGNGGNIGINLTTPSEKLDVNGNIFVGNNSYFLSEYDQTSNSQYVGKRYAPSSGGLRILGGMEIENTTLGGNYSQKLHLHTHEFGASNGKRFSINEKGFCGINKTSPDCMLHIEDLSGGLYTDLQKAIILGADGSNVNTGLNLGNHDLRPFIWCGSNGTSSVNATSFTHGFGWLYRTNGNLQLVRRNGGVPSLTTFSLITYARSDGCVTFSNTSPGCASDDRLKFNEKILQTLLKQ